MNTDDLIAAAVVIAVVAWNLWGWHRLLDALNRRGRHTNESEEA